MNDQYEYDLSLWVPFIEFKQGCDTIRRDKVLKYGNVSSKVIKFTKITSRNAKCKILLRGKVSDHFGVSIGVRH